MKLKNILKDMTTTVKKYDPETQLLLNTQLKQSVEQAATIGQCRIKFMVMWPTNSEYVKNLMIEYEDIIERVEECNCTPFNISSESYAELCGVKGSAIYLNWE